MHNYVGNIIEHEDQKMDIEEHPLKMNIRKFLAEERKQCVIDMLKQKFSANGELELKILFAVTGLQSSVYMLVDKDEFVQQQELNSKLPIHGYSLNINIYRV